MRLRTFLPFEASYWVNGHSYIERRLARQGVRFDGTFNVADSFGFFYSVSLFEKVGEAGRGKAVFEEKRCGKCHAPEAGGGPENPVKQWGLTAQDLTGLLVYLQNPGNKARKADLFRNPRTTETGASVVPGMLEDRPGPCSLLSYPKVSGTGDTLRTPVRGREGLSQAFNSDPPLAD